MPINTTAAIEERRPQFDGNFSASSKDAGRTEPESAKAAASGQFHGLVGSNAAMRRLFRRIEAVAATRSTVLIVGESGTGKELVARAIHECGARRGSFVALNCAAIPRELVESELFGHRRGAFSGANADHPGLLRAAEGGTVFLDEVTEMSPDLQAKLLRAIQERTVRPVGSTKEIPIDVRIVASTNRDPAEAARSGQLRADLYYRLQVNVLEISPLRDRLDDVADLAQHFVRLMNERNEGLRSLVGIDADAMSALQAYDWPGNVRELGNTIESALTFGTCATVTLDDLPSRIVNAWRTAPTAIPSPTAAAPAPMAAAEERAGSYAEFERNAIASALERAGGNKVQAARILKISRKKLYDRIERYGISLASLARAANGSRLAQASAA
ncbi:MAG TPA: sigma-54 dependent transcriptional regulator [Candidatus Binataceae bacterium]|nr:sigma-54 dependent transcriptional regulator [Candidatus Binataceae bacterium]